MNLPRSMRLLLAAVLATLLVAAACGSDNGKEDASSGPQESAPVDNTSPQYGGSITVGVPAESDGFIPGVQRLGSGGWGPANVMFDALIALNEKGEYEPFLAESIEANDDVTEWTLKLRPDVQFHDGTVLDAEALKWNFDTLHLVEGSLTYGQLQTAGVESMELVDSLTVKYVLSSPNSAFPDLLRSYAGWPISPTAYEADPDGFPMGTGPFKMDKRVRDDRTSFVRNENYWFKAPNGDQLPYLDEIIFRPIPDEDSRVQGFAAGDLDMILSFRGSKVKEVLALADQGNFETSLSIISSFAASNVNILEPPLDDVRIRQALAMANDVDAVAKVLGDDGFGQPITYGLYSYESIWFSQAVSDAYPEASGRDVEGAKALVDEYRNDPNRSDGKAVGDELRSISYICPTDPQQLQLSVLWQGLWDPIGVHLDITQVEETELVSRMYGSADQSPPFRGNYDISCNYTGGGQDDPLTRLRVLFGPIATTPGNVSNLVDSRIDGLLDDLSRETDFATRYAIVEEIGFIVEEEMPIIWGSATPRVVGYRNTIHGVKDWVFPSGNLGNGTPEAQVRFHQVFVK